MDFAAWVILILLVLAWVWAVILWRIDHYAPGIATLHMLARTQEWSALLGTGVALLAASRLHLFGFMLDNDVAIVVLVAVLVGVNIPGAVGLFLFVTNRLGNGE